MKNKIYKILDMILLVVWCIFMTIRSNFPKSYPPMDKYFLLLIILLIVDSINLKKNDIYSHWKDDIENQIIRGLLFIIPFVYAYEIK